MASLTRLITDDKRFAKALQRYKDCSGESESMQKFINNQLLHILERTLAEKAHLKVLAVGSSDGELDLRILSVLHQKYPQMTVDHEVVEPNPDYLSHYRDVVSQTPGLDYITFTWNQMTIEEFQEQLKEKKITKKVDFIHMFQMLYYVTDLGATISFYQSLLNLNGKLVLSLDDGESCLGKLGKTFVGRLCQSKVDHVTVDNVKKYLDSKGVIYQSSLHPSPLDISDCFTKGEEKEEERELMLDFLTCVLNFSKSVSPELRAEVLEFLRHSDCSVETDGKVTVGNGYEVVVLDPLI